jgi:hypothetical protein
MTANPDGPNGVFDRTRTDNPFNNYTIVEVLYCSGDVFLGNVTQKWKTPYGDEAKQVGQLNTMATVQWLRTQLGYDTKSTPSPLASLVISGDSAGSMGAQIWSGALLQLFPADYAAVVPDSFVGYFPKGTQESILKDTWPPCAGPMADFVSEAVCQQAAAGQMNLQLWMASVVKAWPTVPFAWVQAKEDVIQIEFYSAIAATFFQDPILLPEQLYAGANEILLGYDTYPNTLHYIIDDGFHTYTELPRFYTADTTGPLGGGKVQPLLQVCIDELKEARHDWSRKLNLEDGKIIYRSEGIKTRRQETKGIEGQHDARERDRNIKKRRIRRLDYISKNERECGSVFHFFCWHKPGMCAVGAGLGCVASRCI